MEAHKVRRKNLSLGIPSTKASTPIWPLSPRSPSLEGNRLCEPMTPRKLLYEFQLRDAIVRQEICKSERENCDMKKSIDELKIEILQIEKELNKEERLLIRQEEDLSSLHSKILKNELFQIENTEKIKESVENYKELINYLNDSIGEEANYFNNTKQITTNLKYSLHAQNNDVMENMRELISIYEDQLKFKDHTIKDEEDILNRGNQIESNKNQEIAEMISELKNEEISNQKYIYSLQKKVEIINAGKLQKKIERDLVIQKESLNSAEDVLSRLKQKLKASEKMEPFVKKLGLKIEGHRDRIIRIDLSLKK
ncbi:unnamed protein product [Blepharisma stoltei]|uniref:Uncharacterized protein n=1 Tax=Blepharisma stoltei TaxID=1481888 RepID=A0AAU9K1N0_9CILI|nr:unnamed protein product [Blepharisma stoltei]